MEKQQIKNFWRHFKKNRLGVGGLVIIVIVFFIAIFASFLSPYDYGKTDVSLKLKSPSFQHYLGTDQLGRDVFSRMLYGSQISLSVGFVAVGISILIGILVGAMAGYKGGWVDSLLMRFVDIMLSFPSFFLILTVVAILRPNIYNVMIVIGITSWEGTARFVRAEFLSLRERDYVQAARALGVKDRRIIFRHILPNALAPVFVTASLGVASAILIEAGLSFLGFGVQPPAPSWGNILTEGRTYIFDAWWLTVFPGLAILITVLSFNLFGEGLRDAIDPRLRGRR
ncbi:MAG: peptide ABC transporter permease [Deltaproteobacteria bacterium CG_4_8_14_3_um_filter_45_9]|nr:MAG: peptide ABC transporter permease [Deltaproteobacteria bacterium CG03_land_8_20_14_0_80_45_14]PIX22697.1 MAG: peptide ABC transporter permease [Deltaproteobacteria bacterium CG_4_8_14_3_um_filter_45_9]